MLLSTTDAARLLGISDSLLRRYVREGRLPAQKVGGIYLIDESDLARIEQRPKSGRPRKQPEVERITKPAR